MKPIISKEDREYINDILVDLDDRDDLRVNIMDGVFVEWSKTFLPLRLLQGANNVITPIDKVTTYGCLQIGIGPSFNFASKHRIGFEKFEFYEHFKEILDNVKYKLEEILTKYDWYKLDIESSSSGVNFRIINNEEVKLSDINENKIIKFTEFLHKNTYPKYRSLPRLK